MLSTINHFEILVYKFWIFRTLFYHFFMISLKWISCLDNIVTYNLIYWTQLRKFESVIKLKMLPICIQINYQNKSKNYSFFIYFKKNVKAIKTYASFLPNTNVKVVKFLHEIFKNYSQYS